MKYETKIIKGSKLSEVYTEMIENDWQLDYYDKEEVISLWKREIKQKRTPKEKPKIDDTILYQENRDLWKSWNEELKEKYKEFRFARYETHKDYVSPLWEKKLLNILKKYPHRICLALLESSLTYKTIVEKQDVIDREMKAIQEENAKLSDTLQKQQEEKNKVDVMEAKARRRQKIEESWFPESYWIEKAKEQLRERGIKDEFMWPMIPATINKLLDTN